MGASAVACFDGTIIVANVAGRTANATAFAPRTGTIRAATGIAIRTAPGTASCAAGRGRDTRRSCSANATTGAVDASIPTGQWVYMSGYGWVWVPAGATTTATDGVPYVYLYTPAYGWNWYISPWGWGGFHYGAWVARPWLPVGWRGTWGVAHPRVFLPLRGHARFHR